MARRPAPNPAQARRLHALGEQAILALGAGDLERAETLADEALRLAPGLPPALAIRASVRVRVGRYDEAERDILDAIRSQPSPPPLWVATLALVYRGRGELDRAIALLRETLARDPGAQVIVSNLGELLATARRTDEAYELLADSVRRGADRPGLIAQFGRVCRVLGKAEAAVAPLRKAAADQRQPPTGRQMVLFELGMVLDELARYDEAFEAFQAANALEPRRFDLQGQSRATDEVVRVWTPDRLASMPRVEGAGEGLVFIVGMRRSGTTLTEQMLGAHPAVHGAGELNWLRAAAREIDPDPGNRYGLIVDPARCTRAAVEEASRSYLERAATLRGGKAVFTDKMPANFKLLSLVRLALPAAKVIWCRRDPAETCLSCYMQPFNDNSYCADLTTLAAYHHDCERLMTHWRETLPLPIYELQHETLLREPERTLRDLLAFLGLPYDGACLRFEQSGQVALTRSTDQVARGLVRRASRRTDHYRTHLQPLLLALDRFARERAGERGDH